MFARTAEEAALNFPDLLRDDGGFAPDETNDYSTVSAILLPSSKSDVLNKLSLGKLEFLG